MEFVDGIDGLALLRECARRSSRLPNAIAVHIVQSVLDALDFAHNQVDAEGRAMGIIHRDISPSNVLLSRRGDVKLVDFGIARAYEQDHHTKAGTLKGKYGYMSPEQVIGESLDPRSDLFACGIVLAELLTGRRLFAATNELDVLLMVRDVKLDRLEQFGAEIDPALMSIVRMALRKDRSERYLSAAIFREALDEWMFAQRTRVGVREISELVATYYDSAWRRRREHMASVPEVVTAISDLDGPGLESGAHELAPATPEIDGIPSGISSGVPERSLHVTDSMPVISVEGGEELPRLELPPPGEIGRALDIQLAEAAAQRKKTLGHDSGPWDLKLTPRKERASSSDEIEAGIAAALAEVSVPEPIGPGSEKSVRYPSIADAVVSVSIQAPDPSATDFDDSDVDGAEPPKLRSGRHRLPTADELARAPSPSPPELTAIADDPAEGGDLVVDPPIRVLCRLMASSANGLLVMALGGIRKDIYFVKGAPEYVSSNMARELFGEYLVSQQVISSGELAMALAMMPHYSGKLGDTLVGLGLLKPLEVFRHLTKQVRQKLIDVCTWTKGSYRWYPGRQNPREAFPLALQRYEVLGAGAMALPSEAVESFSERLAAKRPHSTKLAGVRPEDFELGQEVRKIYDSLDGKKTVAELRDRYPRPEDRGRFLRLLYLLINTGLASIELRS
jgi:hypothetical protein